MNYWRIVSILGLCAAAGIQGVSVSAQSKPGERVAAPDLAASAALPAEAAASDASSRLVGATTAPLGDLNLIKSRIPELLIDAQKAPYQWPADLSCEKLADQINGLTAILGPDLDVPRQDDTSDWASKGGNAVGDAAVGALQGFTGGIIPFRGWVRKLTGAEQHAKDVVAAVAAGTVRRAYLKGVGQARGCAAPAAPLKSALAMPQAAPASALMDGARPMDKVVPSKN
ncbi:MAG: hypothetical protein JOY60_03330 [Burkholderiaceae bacterium]|nr:hypothetical protein [Roseateles sp.]MBV8468881.1 hypothetical protein [Burkholderiaceae bacterium]